MNKLLASVAIAALLAGSSAFAADTSPPSAPESHMTAAPNAQGSEAGAPKRHHTGKHHHHKKVKKPASTNPGVTK